MFQGLKIHNIVKNEALVKSLSGSRMHASHTGGQFSKITLCQALSEGKPSKELQNVQTGKLERVITLSTRPFELQSYQRNHTTMAEQTWECAETQRGIAVCVHIGSSSNHGVTRFFAGIPGVSFGRS